jgi:phage tail-like protein
MANRYIKKYKIGNQAVNSAASIGMRPEPDAKLVFDAGGEGLTFFMAVDGVDEGCEWGRLAFDADTSEDTVFTVYAFASDQKTITIDDESVFIDDYLNDGNIGTESKLALFKDRSRTALQLGIGMNDLLIFGREGRYLWFCIQVRGANAVFSNIRLYAPGENFYHTFPEVYRAGGDFFRRYITLFSVIYGDMQNEIDGIPNLLDPENAPHALLETYLDWFGISVEGLGFETETLRNLLKEAFFLIRKKGTYAAIESIARILTDSPCRIIEQQVAVSGDDPERRAALERLFGKDPNAFTLIVLADAEEKLQYRLKNLIDQFKPLSMECRIVFSKNSAVIEGGAGLDLNASLILPKSGSLDKDTLLDNTGIIKV